MQPVYADWQAGEVHGGYRIDAVLSDSLIASFYRATSPLQPNEPVVLMVLHPGLGKAQPELVARAQALVRWHSGIRSPHIMPLVEVIADGDRIIWVHQAAPPASLTQLVYAHRGGLPEADVRQILGGVAAALQAARSGGMGHFFLTPDFVFVDGEGSVQVAGFGLLEAVEYRNFEIFVSGAINPLRDASRHRMRFAAIEILSPEIRNEKRFDPRGDIYALGMCGYFALAGTKPVRNWITPNRVRPDIMPGWDLLISHCLEPTPAKRFTTAAAFLQDLARLDNLGQRPRSASGGLMRTLASIPLPHRIEQYFSLRMLFYIRLGLLGAAGMLALLAAALLFDIIFEDIEEPAPQTLRRVAPPLDGNWRILVVPERAKISLQGSAAGSFVLDDGELRLIAAYGRYIVRVENPFCATNSSQVTISRELFEQRVELPWQFAPLRIAAPHGARIDTVDAQGVRQFIGFTVQEGTFEATQRLFPGEYRVLASLDGYAPVEPQTVQLGVDRDSQLSFELTPLPAGLTVTAPVAGAEVWVDDQRLGEPGQALTISPYRPEVTVSLRLTGHRTAMQTLQLRPGGTHTVQFAGLEPARGDWSARVRVDGAAVPAELLAQLRWRLRAEAGGEQQTGIGQPPAQALPAGSWRLQMEHADLVPYSQDFTMEDRQRLVSDIALTWLPASLSLMPTAQPADLRIEVDGRQVAGLQLTLAARRPSRVRLLSRDYLPAEATFAPAPGERLTWQAELVPLPGPQPGQDWIPPHHDLPMLWVAPGAFAMGSPINEELRLPSEGPQTRVRLPDGFWIGRHEVTQDLYTAVMQANPSRFQGARHPVDSVSWDEAMAFCERLSAYERAVGRLPEGWRYRLPTEAEWEYAARAGTEGPFAFGDRADPSLGNFRGSYPLHHRPEGAVPRDQYGTLAVGGYGANAIGLFDVHGNVREWTLDAWIDRLPGGSVQAPWRDSAGARRVVRGGGWDDAAARVRLAARDSLPVDSRRDATGFRVVLARDVSPTRD
jgi:formylglycine-generating enzyme required for sulfatase activity